MYLTIEDNTTRRVHAFPIRTGHNARYIFDRISDVLARRGGRYTVRCMCGDTALRTQFIDT